MERYQKTQLKYPSIGDIRGMGGMIGIEFVKNTQTKEAADGMTAEIIRLCASKGLLVESAGTYHNVIRFLAPLVITEEQLEAGLDIFEEAIQEASQKNL